MDFVIQTDKQIYFQFPQNYIYCQFVVILKTNKS